MKYIVETLSTFRNVHVVEADSEEDALLIANNADDNWQEWLGLSKLDIRPYSDELKDYFKSKGNYFWTGISSISNDGYIIYKHSDDSVRVGEKIR